MRHYELVLLVHPDQSEQVPEMINRYQETVKKSDGVIHRTEDIGRMPLAYTIEDMHKAHYVLMNIESNEGVISELESLFKFNDSIIRNLILSVNKVHKDTSALLNQTKEDNEKDTYQEAREAANKAAEQEAQAVSKATSSAEETKEKQEEANEEDK